MKNWLIYGATTELGEFLAKQSLARGLRPILADEKAQQVTDLGIKLGLNTFVLDRTTSERSWENLLKESDFFVNCTSRRRKFSEKILSSCLKFKTHYLDTVAQEFSSEDQNKFAGEGLCLIAGLNPFVATVEFLALKLKSILRSSQHLEFILIPFYPKGTKKLMINQFLMTGCHHRNIGKKSSSFHIVIKTHSFLDKKIKTIAVPWHGATFIEGSANIPPPDLFVPTSVLANLLMTCCFLTRFSILKNMALASLFGKYEIEAPMEKTKGQQFVTSIYAKIKGKKNKADFSRLEIPNFHLLFVNLVLGFLSGEFIEAKKLRGLIKPSYLLENEKFLSKYNIKLFT